MDNPVFCKDCKHYLKEYFSGEEMFFDVCLRNAKKAVSLVNGSTSYFGYLDCHAQRADIDGTLECGPIGKYFEARKDLQSYNVKPSISKDCIWKPIDIFKKINTKDK